MKYRQYSAEDFAKDSFFIRWVKNPDAESDWFWKSFIKENPDCGPRIEIAREMIVALRFEVNALREEEADRMRNSLMLSMRAEKEELNDATRSAYFGRAFWLKIAATVLIIPFLFFGSDLVINGVNDPSSLQAADDGIEVRSNPSGQKSVLFLRDGTKIWLNAASKISYAKDFSGQATRDVYLEGEAFFDVAHDKTRPFVVHTSDLRIKVLGTSFNVKSFSEENTVETTLIKGRVRIEQPATQGNSPAQIELLPNQRAVFYKEMNVLEVAEVTASNSGSWRQDRMVFDAETVDNVLGQLERWYDVTIVAENRGSLKCKLTATIEKESLEEVLKLIAATHNVAYRIEGRKVMIEGKLCRREG